jgi:hypothetical protein
MEWGCLHVKILLINIIWWRHLVACSIIGKSSSAVILLLMTLL